MSSVKVKTLWVGLGPKSLWLWLLGLWLGLAFANRFYESLESLPDNSDKSLPQSQAYKPCQGQHGQGGQGASFQHIRKGLDSEEVRQGKLQQLQQAHALAINASNFNPCGHLYAADPVATMLIVPNMTDCGMTWSSVIGQSICILSKSEGSGTKPSHRDQPDRFADGHRTHAISEEHEVVNQNKIANMEQLKFIFKNIEMLLRLKETRYAMEAATVLKGKGLWNRFPGSVNDLRSSLNSTHSLHSGLHSSLNSTWWFARFKLDDILQSRIQFHDVIQDSFASMSRVFHDSLEAELQASKSKDESKVKSFHPGEPFGFKNRSHFAQDVDASHELRTLLISRYEELRSAEEAFSSTLRRQWLEALRAVRQFLDKLSASFSELQFDATSQISNLCSYGIGPTEANKDITLNESQKCGKEANERGVAQEVLIQSRMMLSELRMVKDEFHEVLSELSHSNDSLDTSQVEESYWIAAQLVGACEDDSLESFLQVRTTRSMPQLSPSMDIRLGRLGFPGLMDLGLPSWFQKKQVTLPAQSLMFQKCLRRQHRQMPAAKRAQQAPNHAPNQAPSKTLVQQQDSLGRKSKCEDGQLVGKWTQQNNQVSFSDRCCTKTHCFGCAEESSDGKTCIQCMAGYTLRDHGGWTECILCDDEQLYQDSEKRTCHDYQSLCSGGNPPGDNRPYNGLKPSDACCACGGGTIQASPVTFPLGQRVLYNNEVVSSSTFGSPVGSTQNTVFQVVGDLSPLKLNFDAKHGTIEGTTPPFDESAGSLEAQLQIVAFQDLIKGISSTVELDIEIQPMSYGPKVLVFALEDEDSSPKGTTSFQLKVHSSTLNDLGQSPSYSLMCVPTVAWLQVDASTGELSYKVNPVVDGDHDLSDQASCTVTAKGGGDTSDVESDAVEVATNFGVARYWVWGAMKYEAEAPIVARTGRLIPPITLKRVPPEGFSVFTKEDEIEGVKELWFKKDAGKMIEVPPAVAPEVLDVKCEGLNGNSYVNDIKWSRTTGLLTLQGQAVLTLDPVTGTIFGETLVELPQRLGKSSVELKCHVAATSAFYDTILTTSFQLRIEDDTCFFEKPFGQMFLSKKLSGKSSSECQVECRKRQDCGAYAIMMDSSCLVQTSSRQASGEEVVSSVVDKIYVRALCEEETACLDLVNSTDVAFLEGKYCPKGMKSPSGICSHAIGNTGSLKCSASGPVFLLFTTEPKQSRFGQHAAPGSAEKEEPSHFLEVQYSTSEAKWQYYDSTSSTWKDFTPDASDVLVAKIEQSSVEMLTVNSWHKGIHEGYAAADSDFRISIDQSSSQCTIKIAGRFLTVWNCNEKETVVYSRDGQTAEDEFIMAHDVCPLDGRYGSWVMRRFNRSDAVTDTGEVELRGEIIACFAEDFAHGAFEDGRKSSTLWLKDNLFSAESQIGGDDAPVVDEAYQRIKDKNDKNELSITASLRAQECQVPFEEDTEKAEGSNAQADANSEPPNPVYMLGTLADQGFYTLDACECFGEAFRDVAPVTDEARGLVPEDVPSRYNSFPIPPVLLFEGPFVCNADAQLIGGFLAGLDEESCKLKCLERSPDCKFFLHVPAVSVCHLLKNCERLALTEPSIVHKLFGVLPNTRGTPYCVIADSEACWAQKLRRELLEDTLSADDCAFASVISECDTLHLLSSQQTGTCSKCVYFKEGSSAFQGRRKVPMPTSWPSASQVSVSCNSRSRLMSATTRTHIAGHGVLTCVDGTWRNPEGNAGLSQWNCASCVQVAQADYATRLVRSMPEVYYIERRKVKYHFGDASQGCKTASYLTAAPLKNGDGMCLTVESVEPPEDPTSSEVWKVGMSSTCQERWYVDQNGGLSPERFANFCLSVRRRPVVAQDDMFEAHIRSCSDPSPACDKHTGAGGHAGPCVGDLVYYFDRAGRLRNGFTDQRDQYLADSTSKISQLSCLTSSFGTYGRPHFIDCAGGPTAQTTWYFDGGDCHFTQRATSEMRSPLHWTYVLGENIGAPLRADTDTKVEQEISYLKKSMNRYAFGSCRANILLSLSHEFTDEQLSFDPNLNMRDFVNQKDLDEKYIPAYHVGSAASTLFTCPVKLHGGSKQFQALKERIDALKAEVAEMEGRSGCVPVQWETQTNSEITTCADRGCMLGKHDHVLTKLVSEHQGKNSPRTFQYGISTLSQEDVRYGVRFGEYRPPLPTVQPPQPGVVDKSPQNMACELGFAVSVLRRSFGKYDDTAKWEVTCVEIKGIDKTRLTDFAHTDTQLLNTWQQPMDLQVPKDFFIGGVYLGRFEPETGASAFDRDRNWVVTLRRFCKDTTEIVKKKKQEIEDLKAQLAGADGNMTCATDLDLPPELLGQLHVAFQGNDQGRTVELLASAKCHWLSTGEVPLEELTLYSFTGQQFLGIVRDTQYTIRKTDMYRGEPFEIVAKEGPAEFAEYGWFANIDDGATVWGIWCPYGSVVAAHDRIGDGSPHCIEAGSQGEDIILTQQLPASTRCPAGFAVSGWYNLPGLHKVVRKSPSVSGPKILRGFTVLCRAVPHVSSLCEVKDAMCEENDVIAGLEYTAENSLKYRCCKMFRPVGVIFQPKTGLEKIKAWEGYYCPVHYDLSGRPSYKLDRHLEGASTIGPSLTNSDGTEVPGITAVGMTVTSAFFESSEKTITAFRLQDLQGPVAECSGEGALMNQWQVAIHNNRMHIKYTCVTNLELGSCSTTTRASQGLLQVNCGQGAALKRWRLESVIDFVWTFEQTCCSVAVEQTQSQVTKDDTTTDRNLRNLANIDFTCALGAVMNRFEITTSNGGVTVNAKWFCQTLAPPQTQFMAALPRKLAPVTRALWNLERHESGSLGQSCPGGSVMTEFQALPAPVGMEALDQIRFTYTCMSPGLDAAGVYGLGSRACRSLKTTVDTNKKWTAQCNYWSSAEAIGSWKVVTDGTEATRIEYTCCTINQWTNTVRTERKALWTVLDSGYSCSPGEALLSFELMHEGGSSGRLTYTCVTIKTARRLPDMVSSDQGGRLQWDPFLSSWMLEPSEVIQIIQPVKMEAGFEWNSACPTQFTVEGWRFELFGDGLANLLLTCRKVAYAVCDAEFTEQADQTLECKREDSKAMGSLQFTRTTYENSVREVFDTQTHCCAVPLEPSEGICERRQTAKIHYDGKLHLEADSIWAEPHMAVDCQGKALASFKFIWSETTSLAPSDVTIEYRCCSLKPYREQLAGLHSAASRPQDVVAKVADTEQAKQEQGRRAENRNVYEVVVDVQYGESVEFRLDGNPYKFNGEDSKEFHWLVLDPLTHHFKGNYHMKHGDVASENTIITQLRDLPAGSVVIIGTSVVTQFSAAIQFALHSLGSRRPLQFDVPRAFAMVGVVPDYGDMPKVLGEESHPEAVLVKTNVPHFFSVAPIDNFDASYVQSVQKKDVFPGEKPVKPELASFKSVEPEFDPFCDLQIRTNLQSVDCELQPSKCPGEDHPCHHTYEKKVDEGNFWQLTQRDIDRAYSEGLADVAEKKVEKDINEIEKTFKTIKLVGQIAAAFAAAFAPGSHGVTADKGAEKAGDAAETIQKVAKVSAQKIGKFLVKKAGSDLTRNVGRRTILSLGGTALRRLGKYVAKPGSTLLKTVGAGGDNFKLVFPPKQKPEKPKNKFDTSTFSDLPEVLKVPQPKKAPAWEENLKQFNLANYMDDNPIQTGLSKIMCDLYCTESAVKQSSDAILESIQSTATTLQDNMQKLMDYHSQLIFYGLGQLREDLAPNGASGALAQEEAELKESGAASSLKSRIESELKKVPTLELNIDPSASSIKTMQWLKDAGQDLLNSVATILAHTAYSNSRNASALNASDTFGTLTSVRSLVENFLAVKELQFSASAAANKKISQPHLPLVIQETVSKKLKVVDKYLMQHEHELKTAMTFLTSVKSTEKLFSLPSLGDVATSLASMRWSSLVTAFTEAHQKHSVFTDSKARALSAAREALRMAEAYMHCKGHSIADLQLQWQRAMRLHDDSGTLLLQAWASTIAAHETLDSAVQSHLLHELAATAAVGDVSSKECLSFDSLVQFAHFHGVQAVERALTPVLMQVMALDAIGLHQEKELKRMKLEASAKRNQYAKLDDVIQLLGDIANRSAEPGPDSLQLAARVLNIVGSQICPAGANISNGSTKCSQGLTLLDTHWAVAKPGDLITSTSLGSALLLLTSCQDDTTQAAEGQQKQGSEVRKEADGKRKEETRKKESGGKETVEEKPERITRATKHKTTDELLESMFEKQESTSEKLESLSEKLEVLLQGKPLSSSETNLGQTASSSALSAQREVAHLCGENCAEKFQSKLESQTSFLREFAELWIHRP